MNAEEPKTGAEDDAKEPESYEAKLIFRIPEGMASRYAHHLVVQPSDNEVVLSFFEILAPLIPGGTPEEKKEIFARGIRTDCVARITVAKNRYSDFARAINEVLPVVTGSSVIPGVESDKDK